MALTVEIDRKSGFCGGVIRAISRSEKYLDGQGNGQLYSLGSIVHNEEELDRLGRKGLVTIGKEEFEKLKGSDVLIRAHGEPPATYEAAKKHGVNLIDCTCPVVLQLQKNIREAYARHQENHESGHILIFGKIGHAEVLGLVGQVNGDAIVVDSMDMLHKYIGDGTISLDGWLEVFSQTTKSPSEYKLLCEELKGIMKYPEKLVVHETICSQVSSRHSQLSSFSESHDVIVFVSGKASSNGKVLYELCLKYNPRTHLIGSENDIRKEWFKDGETVGVCGATSTPKWLLEQVAQKILLLY